MDHRIPLKKPQPDAQYFMEVIKGKAISNRPPLIDLKVDRAVMKPIVEELLNRQWVDYELLGFPPLSNAQTITHIDRSQERQAWDNFIAFWYKLGYDVIRVECGMVFPRFTPTSVDKTMLNTQRKWADLSRGMIEDCESFERYPWPKIQDIDLFPLEYISSHLPDGMGLLVSHSAGVFEHVSEILSYEKMCYLLYDNPELVRSVTDRVGSLMESFYQQIIDIPRIYAIFPGDDLGFKSSLLVSPKFIKELILPWHARFACLAHDHAKLFFMHSCGNVYQLMPDLIKFIKIDAKHSFEDGILPVEDFLSQYGDQVAALGGLDVGVLTQSSAQEVTRYVRKKIEKCAPYKRFAIGTGSSVTSYIPVENYLAMIQTVLSF
jgi:uroporphyrinogen decarboxylase